MFVVDSVAVGVGKTPLLRDVSFSVEKATMTAIVGVNGVGKSTLLRALAGVRTPQAGKVLIDGADLHALSPRQRATTLSMVGQEEIPPGDVTVQELVSLGRLPHIKPWQLGGVKDKHIVAQVLAAVGIADLANKPCDQLSGGQRKLALLARSFAQQTPVVVLDEPTNHLDVHHQLHVLQVLRESGRTIVATIHDLDLAMSHCDQVVVLHRDTTLCVGPPQQVLVPDTLREVFQVQALMAQLPEAHHPHLVIDCL